MALSPADGSRGDTTRLDRRDFAERVRRTEGTTRWVWSDTTAWSTTTVAVTPPPIAPPGASDDVVFDSSTDNENETVSLNGAQSALSILFRSTGTTTLLGGTTAAPADDTLTIGSGGITLQAGAGAVTIGQTASPGQVGVLLGDSQTWTNNSSSLFTVANGIAGAAALWLVSDLADRGLSRLRAAGVAPVEGGELVGGVEFVDRTGGVGVLVHGASSVAHDPICSHQSKHVGPREPSVRARISLSAKRLSGIGGGPQ